MNLMKNLLPSSRSRLKTALFSTLALTCVTALAQVDPTLVFTELPGNVLTANAGTVKLISGGNVQTWAWLPPTATTLVPIAGALPEWWAEPGGLPGTPPTYNEISLVTLPSSSGVPVYALKIQSDILGPLPPGTTAVQDGTIVSPLFDLSTATAQLPIGVQFNDRGDSVPDGSSTLTLLGGALTLVGAARRRLGK